MGERETKVVDSMGAVWDEIQAVGAGSAVGIDVDNIRIQAAMLAGEDRALAVVIAKTVVSIMETGLQHVIDEVSGRIGPSWDEYAAENDDHVGYFAGCRIGKCGVLLSLIAEWPDDPFEVKDEIDLHVVERRIIERMNEAATRIGLIPDFL